MFMSRHGEIVPNFVRHDVQVMFHSNVCNFFQFLFCPDTSSWVMGTAKEYHFVRRFGSFFFKSVKINSIMPVIVLQGNVYFCPVIIFNGYTKRIVHWMEGNDPVSCLCENPNGSMQG